MQRETINIENGEIEKLGKKRKITGTYWVSEIICPPDSSKLICKYHRLVRVPKVKLNQPYPQVAKDAAALKAAPAQRPEIPQIKLSGLSTLNPANGLKLAIPGNKLQIPGTAPTATGLKSEIPGTGPAAAPVKLRVLPAKELRGESPPAPEEREGVNTGWHTSVVCTQVGLDYGVDYII